MCWVSYSFGLALVFAIIPQLLALVLMMKRNPRSAMVPAVALIGTMVFTSVAVQIYTYYMRFAFEMLLEKNRYPLPRMQYTAYLFMVFFFFLFFSVVTCWAEGRAIKKAFKFEKTLYKEK